MNFEDMSIAEKTVQLKQDFDDVYDKGVSDGKQKQEEEFWDIVQDYGNREVYDYGFYRWNCEYIRPKYKVIPKSGQGGTHRYLQMFNYNSSLKKIEKKYFDLSQYESPTGYTNATSGNYYMFSDCPNLEEIEDVGMKPYYYYATFATCPKLHTIEIIRSNENTIFETSTFKGCTALENIKIKGVIAKNISFYQCPNLSKASIESIIEHLANYAGTEKDLTCKVTFTSECWATLEATTPPEGYNTWKDYVSNGLGWLY